MPKKCVVVDGETYVSKNPSHFSSWFMGILIGGMIGAGAALLSAPRPGVETRGMLLDKGNELKDKAIATAEQTRNRAQDLARQGADRASEMAQRGQTLLEEQKKKVQNTVEGVKQGVRSYSEQNQGSDQGGTTSTMMEPPDQNTTMTGPSNPVP